ncbi:MAG: cation:proton antiporter [Acidobacteriota bacterium]|nr:cation:proton antiporter [Acidobacteriota bacterium]
MPVAVSAGGASFLLEVGAVILVLALLARLAARTGFSPIPLYLIAGLVIGAVAPPSIDAEVIVIESQVAVILLLFMLGVEYTIHEIVSSLRAGYGPSIADFVLGFSPGMAAGLLLGWEMLPSLLLGGVTYVSSSSIVAKVLDDLGRLGNRETPAILSVLVAEDLAMAPYLPLIAVLLAGGSLFKAAGLAVAAAGLTVITLFFAHRHGHVVNKGISHPKSEVVLLTVVGLLLLAGGAAELLNVSAGVVAFLVGLSISGSIADRSRELLSPLRDLFAAIFFVSFGLQIDVGAMVGVLGVAVMLFVVTAAAKLYTGWLAARRISGVAGRLRAGTALVARGEFSIVIAGLGVAAGTESALGPLAATYVLLTAIAGPLLTRYSSGLLTLSRRLRLIRTPAQPGASDAGPAGRAGAP